jgi:two-component system, OmpR family, alkaline phosphatase synthesis response regulator PhoP
MNGQKAKQKILIVDDEEHIVKMIDINVRAQGYESICAYNGEQALEEAVSRKPDIILLDVMMPGMDGIEVCRRLKAQPNTRSIPVIMVSAKSEEHDKIAGLQGGADDYVIKPFNLEELFLRIRAALRQVEILSGSNDGVYQIGSVQLDTQKYQVTSEGTRIDLTLTEFRMLHMFFQQPGNIVTRGTLISELFEREPSKIGRSLDVHIGNLRKKLDAANAYGCGIETVRGIGYTIHE